jgi:Zn-dependent protease with chaperone function
MAITGNDFMHPADLEALDNLRAIPIFGAFTKAFLKAVPERFMLSLDLANKIRIGPNQLPNLYRHLPPICEALGVEQPEFFLEMNPAPNAYTSGDSRAFLTVTSGLVEAMQEEELRAVIAHECGHIACHHVLYHTMADMLVKFGAGLFTLVDMVAQPLQLALLHWSRCSE